MGTTKNTPPGPLVTHSARTTTIGQSDTVLVQMNAIHEQAREQLRLYLQRFPQEIDRLALLRRQLKSDSDLFVRSNMTGHVTSSAAVLNPNGTKILLIHHAFLSKWITPGGHYEEPGGLFDSAIREVAEETGVTDASAHAWTLANKVPLDVDSHEVPARPEKGEGPHVHHDFLYIAVAPEHAALQAQLAEVHDVAWTPVTDLAQSSDRRVLLVFRKLVDAGVVSHSNGPVDHKTT